MAFSAKVAVRYVLATAAAVVLPASIVAAAPIAHPADHSASHRTARAASSPTRGASGAVAGPGPVVMRPASVAPRGAFGRILSARQAASAAQACAGSATYAGLTHNATHNELVTANAICVAESGGQPTVYYCNPTGQDGYYPPVNCSGCTTGGSGRSTTRPGQISDTCAFTAKCNADGAYAISQRGRELFSLGHVHQRDLLQLPDRRAVRGPRAARWHGAQRPGRRVPVPGGLHPGCPGDHQRLRQWRGQAAVARRRQAIRDGTYCLAVASAARRAAVHLRRCNGSATSSGRPWAMACCATPWGAGACATRAARSPRAPRSTWARAS